MNDLKHRYQQEQIDAELLIRFNKREIAAFDLFYRMHYYELHRFAYKLYCDTKIDADDVMQDIFVSIWQNKKIQFTDISKIKPYIYTSIRNGFLNYLEHDKTISKYQKHLIDDEDNFVVEVIESETFSIIGEALSLLPDDCAAVFKAFIDGWDALEIADQLKCSRRTVYNKRNEAISILGNILSKDKMNKLLSLI